MILAMTRSSVSLSLAIAALFLVAAAPPPTFPATRPASPLLARAHRMLANLKDTTYQHVTDIDERTGEYYCDCSGFVSYLIRKELPAHYEAVPFPKPWRHPRAVEFHDAFAAAPAEPTSGQLWQRVTKLVDARPGDVASWRKAKIPEKGVTGHIVLFDSTPKPVAENLYEVLVIDSTSRPHKDDTRKPDQTGVGRGTIYLRTDGDGRPVAFATRSAEGPFTPYSIAIGRPVLP
jgi:hypothetical protein